MFTVYELEKDYYGEGKNEEFNIGDFNSIEELIKELATRGVKTSHQNVSQAIKKHYVVAEKYLVFKAINL